jgi:hypothetical protein
MEHGDISNQLAPVLMIDFDIILESKSWRGVKHWKIDSVAKQTLERLSQLGYNIAVFSFDISLKKMEYLLDSWPVQRFIEFHRKEDFEFFLASPFASDVRQVICSEAVAILMGSSRTTTFDTWGKVVQDNA